VRSQVPPRASEPTLLYTLLTRGAGTLGVAAVLALVGWMIPPDQRSGTLWEGSVDSTGWVFRLGSLGKSNTGVLTAFMTRDGKSDHFVWPLGVPLPHAGDRVRVWIERRAQGRPDVINQLELNGHAIASTPGWTTKLAVRRHDTFVAAEVVGLLGVGLLLVGGIVWGRSNRGLTSASS